MDVPEISGIVGGSDLLRGDTASRMGLIEIGEKGVTKDALLRLMKSPCRGLGNRPPAELLRSRFGTGIVLGELGRIEHGVVS